jgi:nuclear factor of activated T-cells 5
MKTFFSDCQVSLLEIMNFLWQIINIFSHELINQVASVFIVSADCSQLLTSGPATLPDQLMAISQPGQPQNEGQSPVTTLLSQQMPENSPLSSSINTNQNIEKIDLLVSLQNQGNNLTGSF